MGAHTADHVLIEVVAAPEKDEYLDVVRPCLIEDLADPAERVPCSGSISAVSGCRRDHPPAVCRAVTWLLRDVDRSQPSGNVRGGS
jgi:hypothetical protein